MLRWSEDQLKEFRGRMNGVVRFQTDKPPTERAKYRNKKTTVNGRTFDSKLEAARYVQLVRLQEGGVVFGLKCQVTFPLMVNGSLICKYICDFTYTDSDGKFVVEDAKGVRTREYILKKKLMKAVHGIDVIEHRKQPARDRSVKPK